MAKKKTLNEQANEILKIAEENGVQTNFFFVTTFKRYQVQINILTELEKTINEEGALVSKEYVKNRKNLYTNPAINSYNRTADSANKTIGTLLKIVQGWKEEDNRDVDPLLEALRGASMDD